MFISDEKVYYINTIDGIIEEGKFIEDTGDGIWLKLKGHPVNTFVYSDSVSEIVFKDFIHAEEGLKSYRSKMKDRLLKGDNYIKDILQRLSKNEGDLYMSIIKEVLYEKIGINL